MTPPVGISGSTSSPPVAGQRNKDSSDFVLVGDSVPMRKVRARVATAARCRSSVVIVGPTGSGKENTARRIHFDSARSRCRFEALNCSGVSEELVADELFGHERGSFTGAHTTKQGLFELARGGSFLLDEVSDASTAFQAKLLRVLNDREYRRIGGTRLLKLDVRFIAALNRDPDELIAKGLLREDFYYRLKVLLIRIPPLRDRREDIPALVRHFMKLAPERWLDPGDPEPEVTEDAMGLLMEHSWPGNVRELENVLELAAVTARDVVLTRKVLQQFVKPESDSKKLGQVRTERGSLTERMNQLERMLVREYFDEAGGIVSRAADEAQCPRETYRQLCLKHGFLPNRKLASRATAAEARNPGRAPEFGRGIES